MFNLYFYPRSPCGERRYIAIRPAFFDTISIHALLAESDHILDDISGATRHFYPRSPCGERRTMTTTICTALRFLSTLSLRRATCALWMVPNRPLFLSTLSLRRATTWARGSRVTYIISIHALLAESDARKVAAVRAYKISIHALLAESDPRGKAPSKARYNFYPRSPCGERRGRQRQ